MASILRFERVNDLSVLVELALGPHLTLGGNPQEQDAALSLLNKCREQGVSWEELRVLFVEALSEVGIEHRRLQLAEAQARFRPWLG